MSGKDTEEKTLPPTHRKLQKARKKGQISSSKDFVSVSTTTVILIILVVGFPWLAAQTASLYSTTMASINLPWTKGFVMSQEAVNYYMYVIGGVFMSTSFLVIVMSNIWHKKGVPVSLDPIVPKFERINPAEGIKRIFGVRGMIEFLASFLRMCLWLPVGFGIIWFFMPYITKTPACGFECSINLSVILFVVITIASLIFYALIALSDLPIQNVLFKRDMKMSQSEYKREMKEEFGSPEVNSERKRLRRELVDNAGASSQGGTNWILSAGDMAVGLHYIRGETAVPVVTKVLKDREEVEEFIRSQPGAHHLQSKALVERMIADVKQGQAIPKQYYDDVASEIVGSGVT